MIHQKLCRSTSVAEIDLESYIPDIISYLKEALDVEGKRIRFALILEPIQLDLSQAVPIGLILNEAITNAIKYAFDENGGEITVAVSKTEGQKISLTIEDNGKGLPAKFDLSRADSLGMEMMKALSK